MRRSRTSSSDRYRARWHAPKTSRPGLNCFRADSTRALPRSSGSVCLGSLLHACARKSRVHRNALMRVAACRAKENASYDDGWPAGGYRLSVPAAGSFRATVCMFRSSAAARWRHRHPAPARAARWSWCSCRSALVHAWRDDSVLVGLLAASRLRASALAASALAASALGSGRSKVQVREEEQEQEQEHAARRRRHVRPPRGCHERMWVDEELWSSC